MEKLYGTCLLVVFLFSADIISTPVPCATIPATGEMVIMRHDMACSATTLVSNKPANTFPLIPAHWMGSSQPAGVSIKGNTLTVSTTDQDTYCILTHLKCATPPDGNTLFFDSSFVSRYADAVNVLLINSPEQVSICGSNSLTGSNSISVESEKDIFIDNDCVIPTGIREIKRDVNQQVSAISEAFDGIRMDNATLQVNATGSVSPKGSGAYAGSCQEAILFQNGLTNGVFKSNSATAWGILGEEFFFFDAYIFGILLILNLLNIVFILSAYPNLSYLSRPPENQLFL